MSDNRNDQVRVLVTGSRTWTDEHTLNTTLEEYRTRYGDRLVIVHGAATRGADQLAADWCHRHDVRQEPHPANWRPDGRYDRTAGIRRNTAMVETTTPAEPFTAPTTPKPPDSPPTASPRPPTDKTPTDKTPTNKRRRKPNRHSPRSHRVDGSRRARRRSPTSKTRSPTRWPS